MKIYTGVCTPAQLVEFSRKVAFGEDGPNRLFCGLFAQNRSEMARRCEPLNLFCLGHENSSKIGKVTPDAEEETPHGFLFNFYRIENIQLVFWKDQKNNRVSALRLTDDKFVVSVIDRVEGCHYVNCFEKLNILLAEAP